MSTRQIEDMLDKVSDELEKLAIARNISKPQCRAAYLNWLNKGEIEANRPTKLKPNHTNSHDEAKANKKKLAKMSRRARKLAKARSKDGAISKPRK